MSDTANGVTLSFCTADEWAEYAAQKDDTIARLTAENERLARDFNVARDALDGTVADRDAWKANAERLAELLADAVEDESEFDTEWDVEARAAIAAHTKQQKDGEA